MRCIWGVDEVHTIEMQVGGVFVSEPTKEQLEARRLACKEIIVLLINHDRAARSPHYNSIQVMIPARNINALLSMEEVFAWLEHKPSQIVEGVMLTVEEIQQVEDFLYENNPFYARINQLRLTKVKEGTASEARNRTA